MNIQTQAFPYTRRRLPSKHALILRLHAQRLFALVFLGLAILLGAGAYLALTPDFQYVDQSEAFIYPDGAQTILVLKEGGYAVSGEIVASGCYHLTQPKAGEAYGKAEPFPMFCRR